MCWDWFLIHSGGRNERNESLFLKEENRWGNHEYDWQHTGEKGRGKVTKGGRKWEWKKGMEEGIFEGGDRDVNCYTGSGNHTWNTLSRWFCHEWNEEFERKRKRRKMWFNLIHCLSSLFSSFLLQPLSYPSLPLFLLYTHHIPFKVCVC